MRALVLEHLRSNPVGLYGDVLGERDIAFDRALLDAGDPLPDWRGYDLLVVMGGGVSAYQEDEYPWLAGEKAAIREAVHSGLPYFGVCLGSQLLASALGARVYRGAAPELGVNPVLLTEAARRDPVFRGFPSDVEAFEWHSDTFEIRWRPSVAYNFPRGFVTFTIDKNGKTDELKIDQPNNDFWFYELAPKRVK